MQKECDAIFNSESKTKQQQTNKQTKCKPGIAPGEKKDR